MPLTPSETRRILQEIGQHPRKSLGQNFLIDGNIVAKSVELSQITVGSAVVEVGPGLGTLTQALLEAGAVVYAVELDLKLHANLQVTLCEAYPDRLHLIQGDAVEHPVAGFDFSSDYKIVANLPYAISTPWLEGILDNPLPERMVLMLQKEAADRYMAPTGTKSFGAISVFVQAAFERKPGHKVSRNCFYPVPDVDSILLHLVRKSEPVIFSKEARNAVRRLFQQRRKQLRSLCRENAALSKWFEASVSRFNLQADIRPEDVPMDVWESLTEYI